VTLIASGTATLEAALFKRPMVIGYRMHPLSWQLMKRMAYQPWVGLPNILAREFVVPELHPARLHAETAGRRRAGLAGRHGRPRGLCSALHRLHPNSWRDTARAATDAIAQVLRRLNSSGSAGRRPAWWPASTRPAAGRWPGRWWRRR
jgi:lipid-A-disaccharide synthase